MPGKVHDSDVTVATSSGSLVYDPRQYRRVIRTLFLLARAGMYIVIGLYKQGYIDMLIR